jgi:hypothetical protein
MQVPSHQQLRDWFGQIISLLQNTNLWLALFTAMLVIVAGLQTCILRTANQINIANLRPWIPPSVRISGPLHHEPDGGLNITLQFALVNTGHSPASYVFPSSHFYLRRKDHRDDLSEQQNWCRKERQRPVSPRDIGVTVFPNETAPIPQIVVSVSKNDLVEGTEPHTKWLFPVIVGCINYQFDFAGGWHQSRYIYWVSKIDRAPISVEEGDIPAEKLFLEPQFTDGGGFYAD